MSTKKWSYRLKTWIYKTVINDKEMWVTIPGDDTPAPENRFSEVAQEFNEFVKDSIADGLADPEMDSMQFLKMAVDTYIDLKNDEEDEE